MKGVLLTRQGLLRDHADYVNRTEGCFYSCKGNHEANDSAVAVADQEPLVDLVVIPLTRDNLN